MMLSLCQKRLNLGNSKDKSYGLLYCQMARLNCSTEHKSGEILNNKYGNLNWFEVHNNKQVTTR